MGLGLFSKESVVVMYISMDERNERVFIENAVRGNLYFCPICHGRLTLKMGKVRADHFAHMQGTECLDSWAAKYDMSDWHKEWQEQFPEENREVVIEYGGVKHRADILIGNTVVEFQHSRMSNEEFWERNKFYTDAGYDLVWLFDLIEEFRMGRVAENGDSGCQYRWYYSWHTFDDFVPKNNKKIKVFFQFGDDLSEGNYGIESLVWRSPDGKYFITSENEIYDQGEFVGLFERKKGGDYEWAFSIADVQDTLIEVRERYSPCYINKSGSENYEKCDICRYSTKCLNSEAIGKVFYDLYQIRSEKVKAEYTSGCLYRFQDILCDWDIQNDKVLSITYDQEYRVKELVVEKSGERITKTYGKVSLQGKTLLELLRNSNSRVIGAVNLITGTRVKVGNSDYFRNTTVYRVQGYLGRGRGKGYYDDRRDIYGWNRPEWIIEWER